MADLVAMYDAELELGAIIDTDTMRALGPVGGGPNARGELQQFIERMPPAVFDMKQADLVTAWMQFWSANFAGLYAAEGEGDTPPVVEPLGNDDDAARLAELEARTAGGEPPAPAPADDDTDASTRTADTVSGGGGTGDNQPPPPAEDVPPYEGPCFACDGTGVVPGAAQGETATCNLCKGSGRVTATAAA